MSGNTSGCDIVEFCRLIGRLKHLKRTGWVLRGVPEPETVSGHMYRMAVLAMCLDQTNDGDKSKIDVVKCMKMALAHDMGESIVGDLTPHCGVGNEEKFRREEEAMKKIASLTPNGDQFLQLWYEYEAQETPESRIVKDLDRFDMVMQAAEYEDSTGKPKSLQEFFDSTKDSFRSDTVRQWVNAVSEFREKDSPSAENP